MTEPEPKYNAGGVIPGEPVEVRIQVGERIINATDGTVHELQEVEGGYQWVKIGHVNFRQMLERINQEDA